MNILVIAATKAELMPFYKHFNLPDKDFVTSKNFDVLISGVGMVATVFALGQQLSLKKYDLILNLGIAGCFDSSQPLGKIFNVTKDSFADFGAEDHESFIPIDKLGFGENEYSAVTDLDVDLPQAVGITVNTVSGNLKTIEARKKHWLPQIESMEGAAVFYAAKKHEIQVIQVRSISNYVTPRDKSTWKIGLAIENLNNWAIAFLEANT